MKRILLLILLVCAYSAQAKTYYLSSQGNDNNNGLTPATAWKTISKLNASFSSIVAGDSILFNSGDTFYGTVLVGKSGTAALPIVLSAYGTGNKPVISGFTDLKNWTSKGGGISSNTITSASAELIVVTINNNLQTLGRYPNANAGNGGYLSYESINSGTPSITDNELSSGTDWTGAEVAIRKMHWVIDRCRVVSHTGTTIKYKNPATANTYFGKIGYGYFFQDDIRTLDQFGEWFLNKATKELSVYFGSASPADYTIKVSTIDTLLNCGGSSNNAARSYINIENLSFEGANKYAFFAQNGKNITVKNCSFNNNYDGIYMWNVASSLTEKNNISNCLNNGIAQYGRISNPTAVKNNTVRKCGLFPGMGYSGDGSYCGIRQDGNNSTLDYNRVDSVGYNALEFNGSNVNIRNNYITNFCMTKDDGGGIYTWSNDGKTTYNNRLISNNIVIGGIGASQGTSGNTTDADCIYMDGGANNVEILQNTLSQTSNAGIFMNNPININIKNNTIYNTPVGISLQRFAGQQLLRNIKTVSNIIYPTNRNILYWNAELNVPTATDIQTDMRATGTYDSNYYRNNITNAFDYYYHLTSGGTFVDPPSLNLSSWKTFINGEGNSNQINTAENTFQYNATDKPVEFAFAGLAKKDVYGNIYNNRITIAPYSSVVLFTYLTLPPPNELPVAIAGNDTTITLPVNSIALTGEGTDKDGTISTYAWAKITGPVAATIASPASSTTVVSNLLAGVYAFELTVTDNKGATAKDTVLVTVNRAPNQMPTADAGTNQVITLPVNSTTLTATGSDTDGIIVSYAWNKITGPANDGIQSADAASTAINNLSEGTYLYRLTVTDNDGGKSYDTVQVIVNPVPNKAPVANAGIDQSITLPLNSVVLSASGIDTDGSVVSYAWTKLSGLNGATIAFPTAATTEINGLVEGVYEFELTITDDDGAIAKDVIQVTVNRAPNQAPVAVAGNNIEITLPEQTAYLSGNGTDNDGNIIAYSWTQLSGPSTALIAAPNQSASAVNSLTEGTYEFELTVTDNESAASKDTLFVTVYAAANIPPVANAGDDQATQLPLNNATLNGSATDIDGIIERYNWIKIEGPADGLITSPGSAVTSVIGLVQGTYIFELTVTDNKGATAKDFLVLVVNAAPNQAPVAIAGDDLVISLPLNSVTLTGSATDPDNNIADYTWTKISGPATGIIASANSTVTSVTELTEGVYEFELTVTDNANAVAKDTVVITVNPFFNHVPMADAGNDQVITLPTNSTTLNGIGTDADGSIAAYEWSKSSGPIGGIIASPDAATTSVTELSEGVYTFELKVTDDYGAIVTDTITITVNAAINLLPVVDAGTNQVIILPLDSTTLSGYAADADGDITNYSWTKITGPAAGNIISTDSATTQVTGLVAGLYEFELSVTDNTGAIVKDTVRVNVSTELNEAPVAVAGIQHIITLPVDSTILTGTGTDTDGYIVRYEWIKVAGPDGGALSTPNDSTTSVTGLLEGVYIYELTVRDDDGAISKDIVQVTVYAAENQLPVADAGIAVDITLPLNEVVLTGMGSDTDGTIASYNWSQISGPAALIVSAGNFTTTVAGLTEGVYQFELTVTDNAGGSATDTIAVTVHAHINQLPVTSAGSDQVLTLPVNSTTLNGVGADIDGVISSYNWTKISGPDSGSIASATAAVTSVTGMVEGTYEFELAVTDNDGEEARDTVMIIVNPAINIVPEANAGIDQEIILPLNSIVLTGSGIDTDGTIDLYTWSKIVGPTEGMIDSPNVNQSNVSGLVQGAYQFELTVTDNTGAIAKDTVTVIVNKAPNKLPLIDAGNNQVITLPQDSILLTGTATDTDGSIVNFAWTKISGPVAGNILSPSTATTAIHNLVQGLYEFELTVTDNEGGVAKDTVQVTVNDALNQAPVANAGVNINITLPVNNAKLNGTGTDIDGTVAAYTWTKIGGPADGMIVSPVAPVTDLTDLIEGIYTFELTVTDDDGAIAKSIVQVTVNPAPNKLPELNAGADQTIRLPQNNITLTGIAIDTDGWIETAQWAKISGPAGEVLTSPTALSTQLGNLTEGIYEFRLSVTDNKGAMVYDTVKITVQEAFNILPTANAGTDITLTLPDNTTTLNGTGTDTDGVITGYDWTRISGPATAMVSSPGSGITAVNNFTAGTYEFVLTVTDNKGATAKDTVTVTVNPAPNRAPVANAGTDKTITLPTNTVTLNGSGTDVDGTIASYTWTKISGPAAGTISAAAVAVTNINNLVTGTYQYQLTVTDNEGASSKDTVLVTVNPAPNQAPVANAGASQVITLPVNTTVLSGKGVDADGTITAYQWVKISGPTTGSIESPNSAVTNLDNLVQGIYRYQLTVTDNTGATATDVVQVTVNAALNIPPVANAGSDFSTTLPANTVLLNGIGIDVDGSITEYKWLKISGPATGTIVSPNAATTTFDHLVEGVYLLQLSVTDNSGATAKDTVKVIVYPAPNQLPVANAGTDQVITLPLNNTTLTGSGMDTDGTIAAYSWVKISGPASGSIATPASGTTSINNLSQGIYQFELAITDNSGATSKDTVKITVNAAPNKAPIAIAGADIAITLPVNSITLNGGGTDTDGTIISYEWEKISGPVAGTIATPGSGTTVINNLVQGVYQFRLTVNDNEHAIGRDTIKVTVNAAPNLPPLANAGSDKQITLPINTTTLNGTGADADGVIVSYAWTKISGPATGNIASPASGVTGLNNLVQGVYQYRLLVTDNNGATAADTVKVTVNPAPNQVPVANAGQNIVITLPTNSVTLSGSGVDADGTIATYTWSRIAGPAAGTIVTPNAALTVVNNLVQGTFQYQLTIKDNQGAIAKDTVTVTVNPEPNRPPVANAGPDKVITLPVNTTVLTGTGTDADGTITAYSWIKIAGPSTGTIASPGTAQTTLNNLVAGVYRYQLIVTDNEGAIAKDTVLVTVNLAPNVAPTANAGIDKVITLPTNSTTLNGTGTDGDGSISVYAWTKISGPATGVIASPGAAITAINNLAEGIYLFVLTVTDNNGASAKDTVKITVNPVPNIAPLVDAGVDQVITLPVSTTTLTGLGSDPDGSISKYSWTKLSGPAGGAITSANTASTGVTGLTEGIYRYKLVVTDNNGATAADTMKLTVNHAPNMPPVANGGNDKTLTLPINSTVLTGSATDIDGTVVSYTWKNISGLQGSITTPNAATTVIFNLVKGFYQFELTVTDNEGAIGRDTIQVTVNPPVIINQAPVANAGNDITITLPLDSTFLKGSGVDPDGTIASYNWNVIDGPTGYLIANATVKEAMITGLLAGTYHVELTVADNTGAVARDTVLITVKPARVNQVPVADAGKDIDNVLPVNTAALNGTGTDADGTIVSYKWNVISGPNGYQLTNVDTAKTEINSLFQGVYYVELTVTDNEGAQAKDTVKITVSSPRLSNYSVDEFTVYPNPVRNTTNLSITTVAMGRLKLSVSVTDLTGKLVKKQRFVTSTNETLLPFDMSNLSNGYYIITLHFEGGKKIARRVIKQGGK